MDILSKIAANPLFYMGFIISLIAALGFLFFLKGFLQGVKHLIYISEHEGHLSHAREHIVKGFIIMTVSLIVWEIVRWVFGSL